MFEIGHSCHGARGRVLPECAVILILGLANQLGARAILKKKNCSCFYVYIYDGARCKFMFTVCL